MKYLASVAGIASVLSGVGFAQWLQGVSSQVTSTSATVNWKTCTSSSSTVSYGLTSSYGATAGSATLATAHAVSLSGLLPGTTYHYAVSSADNTGVIVAGKDSTFTTAAATTPPPSSGIKFVQVNAATPQGSSASVAVTYPAAQTAGNLNVVAVGWNDTTSTVTSIVDSKLNAYTLAIGPTTGTSLRQSIYYAKNIAGGSNTVTVTFSKAAFVVDVRILEYAGLDTANPLDKTAGGFGTGTSTNSGPATTTFANELIFGAAMTLATMGAPGSGFVTRIATTPDADIAEDKIVSAIGTYSATAPNSGSSWVMQMATFAASPVAPPPPTHSVDLNWTPSIPVAGATVTYNIYRGTINGGPYSKIGTATGPPFTDINVPGSDTLYYVATAVATNTSGTAESINSNQFVAVIP